MISLLLVNFRSAALAAEAVASARAGTSSPMEVVVVDNSLDPAEAQSLRQIRPDSLIVSERNRGYAGGINAGRPACRGDVIVIANPDVRFGSGALDRLQEAIGAGAAAAGPALFWDDAHRWHLPPADAGRALQKVDEVLASRSRRWAVERDRRRFRRRVQFWSLAADTPMDALSGAVLAVRTADFDELGGFDERFALYFEEIDFLRRLREGRRRVVYVPAARCRHLFNQSARQVQTEAALRYAESEAKYLAKWNGPFVAQVLKKLERGPVRPSAEPLEGPVVLTRDDVVVEASPLADFATAAGCFPAGREVGLPAEVLTSVATPVYLRSVIRGTGEVLGRWVVEPAART